MEEKESRWKEFWNDHKNVIISVGLVALVYRIGYVNGWNASTDAVNKAFKALGDAMDVTKF